MAAGEEPIKSITGVVKELADAVTTQARVCNRTWIALITVAVLVVLPRVAAPPATTQIDLPFSLGRVDQETFYVIGFGLLVALAIGFAAALAQQVRAQKLAHAEVDKLAALPRSATDVHPRDLFDAFREPSAMRVAPLAQLLRGKHQFFNSATGAAPWLRNLSVAYYVLLQLVALSAYFGLPLYALWRARLSVHVTGLFFRIALEAGGVLAALALIQVMMAAMWFAYGVVRIIQRPSGDGNNQPAT